MELFEHIRRDRREDGVSIRGLAHRHRVHRRTVRQALRSALPPPRKRAPRLAPQLGPYVEVIREWLVADLSAPRKQRHIARRIWQRLVDERGGRLRHRPPSRVVLASSRSARAFSAATPECLAPRVRTAILTPADSAGTRHARPGWALDSRLRLRGRPAVAGGAPEGGTTGVLPFDAHQGRSSAALTSQAPYHVAGVTVQ